MGFHLCGYCCCDSCECTRDNKGYNIIIICPSCSGNHLIESCPDKVNVERKWVVRSVKNDRRE